MYTNPDECTLDIINKRHTIKIYQHAHFVLFFKNVADIKSCSIPWLQTSDYHDFIGIQCNRYSSELFSYNCIRELRHFVIK